MFVLVNVRSEYFFRPVNVELKNIEYRKRSFASEFLLPKKAFVAHFGKKRYDIEVRELYLLKPEFGVISENLYKKTVIAFSKNGWKKQE